MAKLILMKQTDVTVHNGGGLYQFELHTKAARIWVNKNVPLETWRWTTPNAFAVEARYAGTLAHGMAADGLEIK